MVPLVLNVVEFGTVVITGPSFVGDPCLALVVTVVAHSGTDGLQVVTSTFAGFSTW